MKGYHNHEGCRGCKCSCSCHKWRQGPVPAGGCNRCASNH